MKSTTLNLTACLIGIALCGLAALPAADAGAGSNLEFLHAAAGIEWRLQVLRQQERQILAHSATPARAAVHQRKREEARRRIDELKAKALAAAGNDEERMRLARLVATTGRADARYARVQARIAELCSERTMPDICTRARPQDAAIRKQEPTS